MIKKYTKNVKKAMEISFDAHFNQFDMGGSPYIYHPIHIAEQFSEEKLICVALLHDVLEDSDYTEEQLRNEFPKDVVDAVCELTRLGFETYSEYIDRVSKNKLATLVKIKDLEHNLNTTRCEIPKSLKDRYKNAYDKLVFERWKNNYHYN